MDEVLRITPGDITFIIQPGELCRVTCQYTNLYTVPISYNVRTTKPDLYCVRLNKDIIQPGETKDVIFIRRAFESIPTELRCRDRFQVLVRILATPELASATIDEIWAERKQYQFERKFQVKFTVDLEAQPTSLELPAAAADDVQNGISLQTAQFPSAAPALPSLPSALLPSSESVDIQENLTVSAPTPGVPPLPSDSDLVPRTATGTVLPAGESFMAVSGLTSTRTMTTSTSDGTTISPPLAPAPGLRADAPPPMPFSAPPLPPRPESMRHVTPPFAAHPAFADQKTPPFPDAAELPRLDSDSDVIDQQHIRAAFDERVTPVLPPRSISVTKKVTPDSSPPSASPEKHSAPPAPPPLPPRVDSNVFASPPLPSRLTLGSDEQIPVSHNVDRLARVEPEVESAAVTAAAATARFRTEEQSKFAEHIAEQSLRKSQVSEVALEETSRTSEGERLEEEKNSGGKANDSETNRISHSFSEERSSIATADSNGRPLDEGNSKVDLAEDDDGEGYAQAEAVTVYTPTVEEQDRRRELNERKRVAQEEEKRRVEEERLRAEAAARKRAEEIARIARETELERVRTRRQVETARAAPRVKFAPLEGARAQRAAVDRACALHRMIREREVEIAKLKRELVEARHMRSNARIGVAPMYDTIYESDSSQGFSFPQLAIMAALSGVLLTLFF